MAHTSKKDKVLILLEDKYRFESDLSFYITI